MGVDLSEVTASPIVAAIVKWRESTAEDWRRDHLGASVLGNECERALWYGFRWCSPPSHDGRLLRLFDTGKREEARFTMELRGIGCTVYDLDPQTGKQWVLKAPGAVKLAGRAPAPCTQKELIMGRPRSARASLKACV